MGSADAKTNIDENWKDPKRWLWLLSPMIPAFGASTIYFAHTQSMPFLLWYMPFLVYFGIPLLDAIVGNDATNPPEAVIEQLESNKYYRYIVFAYLPAQYAITALGAWVAVSGDLQWWSMLGLLLSVGLVNGIGINAAHELGHRTGDFERWLSKLALAPVLYGHFYVEHNRGHHKNVATPNDPASSRMGESFYKFLPRTLFGSLRSAWVLEKTRLNRKNKSVWNIENDNLQAWAMTIVLFSAITFWLGWTALPFLVIQGFFGACLLEVVNYIEHYGLLRDYNEKVSRYERCKPEHSWNSNNVVTNLFLYQLQRPL